MNYRRGLQRAYFVLVAAWIALVVFMVLSDRWICEPWWRVLPNTYDSLAEQAGAGPNSTSQPLINGYLKFLEGINDHFAAKKAIWIAALSLPMPIVGYLLLFGAVPWIYRGFGPRVPSAP